MIKRKYNVVELANSEKELVVVFEGENSELLNLLFNGELENFSDWIKSNIKAVLNQQDKARHISGNICELSIEFTTTKIYNIYADDEQYCEVDTTELFKLINEWEEKKSML